VFSGPLGLKRTRFLLLGVLTFEPILVKIDQEMRPCECWQTDRHTNRQTDFIICPVLYAVAMRQIDETRDSTRKNASIHLPVAVVPLKREYLQQNVLNSKIFYEAAAAAAVSWRSIYPSLCLSVDLSVRPSVCKTLSCDITSAQIFYTIWKFDASTCSFLEILDQTDRTPSKTSTFKFRAIFARSISAVTANEKNSIITKKELSNETKSKMNSVRCL